MSKIEEQAKLVKERLDYYFSTVDKQWVTPLNMSFMKVFLDSVDALCKLINEGYIYSGNTKVVKTIKDSSGKLVLRNEVLTVQWDTHKEK